jgi:hypothetical protein
MVVAYEDYGAGKRAQHACQQILEMAHLDKKLSVDLWKFDMFKLRAMREAAAEEAAGAELLLLAPNGDSELPVSVQEWLQLSLQHPYRPKALLVLLGPDPEDIERPPKVAYQLKTLAVQLSVPFWCLQLEAPSGAWSEPDYVLKDLERVAQTVFAPSVLSSEFSAPKSTVNGNEL